MAGYKCPKCGETATSKCVGKRNVFPNDQLASLLTHSLKQEITYDPVAKKTTIKLISYNFRDDVGPDIEKNRASYEEAKVKYNWTSDYEPYISRELQDALMWDLIKEIRSLPEETLKHWNCSHNWELTTMKCDLDCCTMKLKPGLYENEWGNTSRYDPEEDKDRAYDIDMAEWHPVTDLVKFIREEE